MTIGEKIKYFRTKKGITQGTLAELADIHPVSIRKYETNKMQPQPPQIEKIADALNVSYSALNGVSNSGLRLETLGDFIGFLMVMYDAGIIQVKGKRNPDGSLKRDTMQLKFSPVLTNLLEIQAYENKCSLENILIHIKDETILNDFLNWEKISYCYTMSVISAKESDIPTLEELLMYKNAIELELQSSTKLLENY